MNGLFAIAPPPPPPPKAEPYPYSDTVAQLKRIADALEALLEIARKESKE